MPLPKQETNRTARVVVLLISAAAMGLIFPLGWLLRVLQAPDVVVAPALTIWTFLVLMSVLWTIGVWAPVRGRKIVDAALKSLRF